MNSSDHVQDSEQRLLQIVDSIPGLVVLLNAGGQVEFVNRRGLEYFGKTLEELRSWQTADVVPPDDVPPALTAWRHSVETGHPYDFDHRLRRADGVYRWFHSAALPLTDAKDHIIRWYNLLTDIDDRKRAEEKLRGSEAYLSEAQKLGHTGSFGWDVSSGEIYWSLETFRIFEYEPTTRVTVEMVVQRTHPDDRSAVEQLIERVSREKAEFDFEHRLLMPDGSIKYLRIVGRPSEDETGRSELVGAVTDITERKLVEKDLRRSEECLLEAQRMSHTGSWGHDIASGKVTVSPEIYRIFDIKPGEDVSSAELYFNRVHPEDRKQVREVFEKSEIQKTPYQADYRIVLPGGTIKYIHSVGHPSLNESGDLVEFVGTSMDVTEVKQAEETLRESEAYLAEAQRLSHTGSWAWTPARDIRYWSKECYRVLGFDPHGGEPRFETFFQRIHPDDQAATSETLERAKREGAEFELNYRIVHPGGEVRDIHVVGHPVLSPSGGLVEFVGTVIDVTERNRAEEKIRQGGRELRQLLDLTPLHITEFGPDGVPLYNNQAALDYHGLTLEEWRSADLDRLLHPQDAERMRREHPSKFLSGSPYEFEVRLRRKDGQYRWFLFRFNPIRDEEGHLTRWYAAATDIEDRKQVEQRLQNENVALREEIDRASMFEEILGISPALHAVLSRVSKVAPTDSSVLITGETGTGKELIARAVHKRSQRSSRPFVSVNCAAIPRDLIASELFGHEKGAFTGATQRRLGRFELAEEGTLCLDEVGQLPAETQIALLRVLQEREFERVGGNQPIRVNVRVVAATNRDLEAAIAAGTFRSDLFYRLNVFPIEIPPLRERREDIPLLVEYFIGHFARKAGKSFRGINKKTLDLLLSYPWPGNVRELQNVVERSVIVCETEYFSVDESWLSPQPLASEPKSQLELSQKLAAQEKEMIEAALRESGGRVSGPSGAAVKLGIHRSTLESKIASLKINKYRFKTASASKNS